MTSVVFRRFRLAPRAPVTFVMSVRLSARISAASIGRISLRFDIENFCENLPKKLQISVKSGQEDIWHLTRIP
jgi:hypothetical protein